MGKGKDMGVDKSPTETYPMRLLKVGETFTPSSSSNPVTILACWLSRPSDIDAYAVWVVLCLLPHNTFHPFAVWNAIDTPHDGWHMEGGDYCHTITEATAQYERRGGQYEL